MKDPIPEAGEPDGAKVRFFPPGIPFLALLASVGLQRVWPLMEDNALPIPGRYWMGGILIVGSIAFFGLWSIVLFRRSGQNVNPWKPTPQIVERGPYRITRNPMYLQMVIACVGFAILLSNPWMLLATPVVGWLLQILAIRPEEAYLERKFGQPYLDYKQRVRRWV